MTIDAFDLPATLAAKADPALIAADEDHFSAIAESLAAAIAEATARLDLERTRAGGSGQAALDRDLEVHRLSARLRALRRFRLDACLGRFVRTGDPEPVYIGRFGLTDAAGRRLLVDWRAPAAEPFFAATPAHPLGLESRRRYRWTSGRVTDYWDEAFTEAALAQTAALDEQSAFIASLGGSRSPRMRDVLSTIQADQDAIIRADSQGALVVDGGPGTGKTVVALHRAAYLLYADPRLGAGRGRVLVVGPHEPYLAYVADVLPSLGEDGVQTCTVRDLVPEGREAAPESDRDVAALKASARFVDAVEPAVGLYEEPPTAALDVSTPWADVQLTADEWSDAFAAADPGSPHNEARDQVWDELLEILVDKHAELDVPEVPLRRALARDEGLVQAFARAWPVLDARVVLADLWSVPAYLRRCAPWLGHDDVQRLQRDDPRAWTVEDLPLLDALRQRIGDPEASVRRRRNEALAAEEREQRDRVMDELIAADDSELMLMSILRGRDARNSLDDDAGLVAADPDSLTGPFAHVIVDEAQELTDAEWQMLLRRCPSRSFTVVGDRAQARHGFDETWRERLDRVGFRRVDHRVLDVNYRTPAEIMSVAAPEIRAALPDANVPTSIRESGVPVRFGDASELESVLDRWVAADPEGTACVIGDGSFAGGSRIRSLTPELAKGLEFDLVVLVDPQSLGPGIEGAVDRYVAMTRATRELVILTP